MSFPSLRPSAAVSQRFQQTPVLRITLSLFALLCLMWTIFKVFIELVTMLLLLFMFWFLFVGWFCGAVRHAGS